MTTTERNVQLYTVVTVSELIEGDEVLIAVFSELRRIRLRKTPKPINTPYGTKYSSVMCDILDSDNLNDSRVQRSMYQDLNYRDLFLIKIGQPTI